MDDQIVVFSGVKFDVDRKSGSFACNTCHNGYLLMPPTRDRGYSDVEGELFAQRGTISGVERLYAPWRLAYIKDEGGAPPPSPGSCIFCDKPAEGAAGDASNYIMLRGESCYVILNAFPYSNGHVMVLPYRHIASPVELTDVEGAEMMRLCAFLCDVLGEVFRPHGFNVGMNVGAAAGAGIAAHLHLHIVPRWSGDTNFMPVIGDVKVMPETLDQVYAKTVTALASRSGADLASLPD